jgi:uncharacterized membrane protein
LFQKQAGEIMQSKEAILLVAGLSFTPFVEIIGAVPAGLALHMGVIRTVGCSLLGNDCLMVVLLLLLKPLDRLGWFRTEQRNGSTHRRVQHMIERFGAPSIGLLGPAIGMFLTIPIARGLGMSTVRVALAAMIGNTLFALIYASILSLGVN